MASIAHLWRTLARSPLLVAMLASLLLLTSCGVLPFPPVLPTPLDHTYAVTDLGIAPLHNDGDFAIPNASVPEINSAGQVVGQRNDKAFLWTPALSGATTGSIVDFNAVLGSSSVGPASHQLLRPSRGHYGQ